MVSNIPSVEPTAKFELREVAALLGASKSSVARWTSLGMLRCGGIRRSNHRKFWTGSEILRFWRAEM